MLSADHKYVLVDGCDLPPCYYDGKVVNCALLLQFCRFFDFVLAVGCCCFNTSLVRNQVMHLRGNW